MGQTHRDATFLDDLNAAQREAVQATSGPLVILAGAGTGKTRVISRRAAHAIETAVVPASKVLLVTFTDKAATEMVERMAALGHPSVMARTFHSHAVRQLRHFWPSRHNGQPPPEILNSKLPLIGPLARNLPGHYRFTPTRDIADAIEWAKVRRIPAHEWEQRAPADRALDGRIRGRGNCACEHVCSALYVERRGALDDHMSARRRSGGSGRSTSRGLGRSDRRLTAIAPSSSPGRR